MCYGLGSEGKDCYIVTVTFVIISDWDLEAIVAIIRSGIRIVRLSVVIVAKWSLGYFVSGEICDMIGCRRR